MVFTRPTCIFTSFFVGSAGRARRRLVGWDSPSPSPAAVISHSDVKSRHVESSGTYCSGASSSERRRERQISLSRSSLLPAPFRRRRGPCSPPFLCPQSDPDPRTAHARPEARRSALCWAESQARLLNVGLRGWVVSMPTALDEWLEEFLERMRKTF